MLPGSGAGVYTRRVAWKWAETGSEARKGGVVLSGSSTTSRRGWKDVDTRPLRMDSVARSRSDSRGVGATARCSRRSRRPRRPTAGELDLVSRSRRGARVPLWVRTFEPPSTTEICSSARSPAAASSSRFLQRRGSPWWLWARSTTTDSALSAS